jgi:superfamily I DNA/RNA helicase
VPDWLEGLNPEQRKAASHNHGPLLILAGAGSGKTTVLVARTGRLIDERVCPAEKLCVLTFTNKAAKELKARVAKKLGQTSAEKVWAGTFHSFGLGILRRFHKEAGLHKEFSILDPGDANSLVKETLRDFKNNTKTAYDADKVLSMLSHWRERGIEAASKDCEYEEALEWLLPKYKKKLQLLSVVDFDDLILLPIELMKSSETIRAQIQSLYQQVMVDEFQDTNLMQMRLIRSLTDAHHNLSVVGDDDQSIYGWRGACVSNILDFPKFYSNCEVVRLERNYRSTTSILQVANAVIAKNSVRHAKVLRPHDETNVGDLPEVVVYEDENEEIEQVTHEIQSLLDRGHKRRDIAILYRSNSQGAMLEAELRKQQIPYLMSGGTGFFDRKETRDILAYLRCAFRPNDVILRRILNTPARGIGDTTLEKLNLRGTQDHISFVKSCRLWREAGVDEKAGASIENLFQKLDELVPFILSAEKGGYGEKLSQFMETLGYKAHIEKHASNPQGATHRWRYVQIFCGILDRFIERGEPNAKTIKAFLDGMELRDALEEEKGKEDRVQLLTLHACKGLEFPVVFLLGVEEDILPHRKLGSDLAEERRLFYVGVTRARQRLVITRAKKRKRHGKLIDSAPSRFLLEIPPAFFDQRTGPKPATIEMRRSILDDLYKKLDAKPRR